MDFDYPNHLAHLFTSNIAPHSLEIVSIEQEIEGSTKMIFRNSSGNDTVTEHCCLQCASESQPKSLGRYLPAFWKFSTSRGSHKV
jgi:hypothetical protein